MWAAFTNEPGTWLRPLCSGAKVENDPVEFLMVTTVSPAFVPLRARSIFCVLALLLLMTYLLLWLYQQVSYVCTK